MSILVTGAAGYIGSVVTEQLIKQGHEVVALDNLRHGHAQAVHPAARFVQLDLLDACGLTHVLRDYPVDAVVHLAAEALIDESARDPGRFFRVNVSGGLNLLDAMVAADVKRLVCSSTAAVYGEPERVPIPEDAPCRPVNSYGASKLAFERLLPWYRRAHGVNSISLRYFNACGATERCGEFHVPETHLIPILFEVALGRREAIQLYGTDDNTPDGTCIRDYIHVADIAQAHLLALAKIDELGARTYNMGNGAGYSNRQVIETVRQVTGRAIPVLPADRRPGDPARLVAGAERIREELGWVPRHPDLATMVQTAWRWRRHHPGGYRQ
jgi:UDP-glucose 4-epimerase